MKKLLLVMFFCLFNLPIIAEEIEFGYDNGEVQGIQFNSSRNRWEESVVLQPAGPCKINKIKIYFDGSNKVKDTIYIAGMPTAGNLYPTEFIWSFNLLAPPIPFEYDGLPGWKEFDISVLNLKSDGFDKIVIQHIMKPSGPWFVSDNNGKSGILSWICDVWTANPNFYDIEGTLHYPINGDFMVRLAIEYDYPIGNTSDNPPIPTLVKTTNFPESNNISVADWNGDGWDDLGVGSAFYINNKDGSFSKANLQMPQGFAAQQWADIDNDGDLDFYGVSPANVFFDRRFQNNLDAIFLNNGNYTFTRLNPKESFNTPYPDPVKDFKLSGSGNQDSLFNPYGTCTPVWFDFNQDGKLDLYIANRRIETVSGEFNCPDELWYQSDNLKFDLISDVVGLRLSEAYGAQIGNYYDCYGASAVDYNNDNRQDIYVATYRLAPDMLFKNNPDQTFSDEAKNTGVCGNPTAAPYYFGHGMGSDWADFDNDGDIDLCVGNLAHTDSRGSFSNPSLIFKNQGAPNYKFTEVHKEMGLKFHEGNAGACWADIDLDGFQDLWHGKYDGGMGTFYINSADPNFKLIDITWSSNCVIQNPWNGVRLDFDHDGDIDFIISNTLVRNDMQRKGNWVAFRLKGSPVDKVNMDCYGTKLTVFAGNQKFLRTLNGSAAGTRGAQNSNELHFGVGFNNIDSIRIEYINSASFTWTNIQTNCRYLIEYGKAPSIAEVSTPALKSPANMFNGEMNEIKLEWYPIGNIDSFTVELADNPDFSNSNGKKYFSLSSNTNSLIIDKQTINLTRFIWRVKAHKSDKSSAWSSVWEFSNLSVLPEKPQLILPKNNEPKSGITPIFIWKQSRYTQNSRQYKILYKLEIAEDINFNSIISTKTNIIDTIFQISEQNILQASKTYFWRVSTLDNSGKSVISDTFTFKVLPLPEKTILKNPANNETDVVIKPTFSWFKPLNFASFVFQISKTDNFDNPDYEKSAIADSNLKLLSFKLDWNTKYYWRVAGVNESGRGEWSEVFNFTTIENSSVIDDSQNKFFELYPNPANSELNIKLNNLNLNLKSIIICDLNGKDIYSVDINQDIELIKLDISTIPAGTFILKLKTNDAYITKKFVVIK